MRLPPTSDKKTTERLLAALREHEAELETYRDRLEQLVRERTQELLAVNEELRREIAERKAVESPLRGSEESEIQKAQRLESIGLLAGGIAHDFRNILMTVVGNLSLAKLQLSPGDRVFELLDQAEKAATRAGELTQQLLTFARGGTPVKKVVSIGALLRETVALSLQGSTIWCELSIPDDLWPADIDASQISQVISNLLINAIEAMPRGGKITVSAENSPAGGRKGAGLVDRDAVIFSVHDQGVGIPKELFAKIFDPYFTTKAKGSGLGLATCYAIIKRHSGAILVDSEPGIGSTFRVFLPAAPRHKPAAEPGKGAVRRGRGRVLFMEDDDLVRQTAKTILEFLGYEVEFAAGGEDAIEKYRLALEAGHPFRVAVLDLVTEGGLGGKETGRRLRKMDPKARLVVSSGYSDDPILVNYAECGFDAALAKPYETKDLADVLSRMAEDE